MKEFRVDSRDLGSGRTQIQVEGEIDLAVADRFEAAIERASSDGGQVLVDLSACEFLDSTAIAILLSKQKQLEAGGGRLAAYGASGQVHRILQVAGLIDRGFGFDDVEDALISENIA
jgi:anti-sigma B factor antagonist